MRKTGFTPFKQGENGMRRLMADLNRLRFYALKADRNRFYALKADRAGFTHLIPMVVAFPPLKTRAKQALRHGNRIIVFTDLEPT